MLSLSEQAIFSFQAGYIHSPTYQIPQEKTQEQAKSTTFLQVKSTTFLQVKSTTFLQASSQPSNKQSSQPSNKQKPTAFNKQSPQPSNKQSPQPSYKQKPTATPHPYCSKKHSENKQIQQNIPNILPFNIFLKSVLKKNRLSRLFDLEISIFYCNFATNLLTH